METIQLDTSIGEMSEKIACLALQHVREVSTMLHSIGQAIAPRASAQLVPSRTAAPILDRLHRRRIDANYAEMTVGNADSSAF